MKKVLLFLFLIFFVGKIYSKGDTLYVSNPNDKRLIAYTDSLKLYNNFKATKQRLVKNNYLPVSRTPWKDSGELSMAEIACFVDSGKTPPNPLDRLRYKKRVFYQIVPQKIGNLYKVFDFFPLQINYEIGFQYFSLIIKPKSVQEYGYKGYADTEDEYDNDGRLLYEYIKPSRVVIYKKQYVVVDTIETKKVNVLYTTVNTKGEQSLDSTKIFVVESNYNFFKK